MTKAVFVQQGRAIDHTPSADVAAGDVIVSGLLVGVAERAISANYLGAISLEGIYDIAKITGVIAVGVSVYWDADGDPLGGTAGTGCLTTVKPDGVFAGITVAAAADTDTTARVKLVQSESVADAGA